MARDLNQCNFIGRLGRDPEIKYLPSGSALAQFSIAVGNNYKNKNGEKVDETEWVNLTAFGKTAEIIGQYCTKGMRVMVTGRMKTDKWTDQNGVDRYSTKVLVESLQMLDGGKNQGQQQQTQQRQQAPAQQQQAPQGMDDYDDDIPFN